MQRPVQYVQPTTSSSTMTTRVIYVQQNSPHAQPVYVVPQTVIVRQPQHAHPAQAGGTQTQQPVQTNQPVETRPTAQPIVVYASQPPPRQQQRIVMVRPAATPLVVYQQSNSAIAMSPVSTASSAASDALQQDEIETADTHEDFKSLETAKTDEAVEDVLRATLEDQKKLSRCGRIFDVDGIRPLIDFEFPKMKGIKKRALLVKCFLGLFVWSLVSVGFNIAYSIKVSRREAHCVYEVFEADDEVKTYNRYVVLLWFSTSSAIINTLIFKFGYAFHIMHKHGISFWNSLKYVALHTYLKTTARYSPCCNRHHWLMIIVTLCEDFLQLFVSIRIKEALRTYDIMAEIAVWKSIFSIVAIWGNALVWFFVDWKRGQSKESIRQACHGCKNTTEEFEKTEIPPIDNSKYRVMKYTFVCCVVCCGVPNFALFLVSTVFLNLLTDWDAWQVADINVHVEKMNITMYDYQSQSYDMVLSDVTFEYHSGVNTGSLFGLGFFLSAIGLNGLVPDSAILMRCWDSAQRDLTDITESERIYPIVCLSLIGNSLIIHLSPTLEHFEDEDEDQFQWSLKPLMLPEWNTSDYEVLGFENWVFGPMLGGSVTCHGNGCDQDKWVVDETSSLRMRCRFDYRFRCDD